MRSITCLTVLAALPSIYAVSLSDFLPYLSDLPSACDTVYKQQVSGCKTTDFTSGRGCTTDCISGLQALVAPITLACSNANVFGNSNVVNTFITSDGVKSLCPNAPAAAPKSTSSSSSTSSTAQQQTTTQAQTTAAITTSASSSTSSTSTTATTSDVPVAVTTSSLSTSSSTSSATQSTSASSASAPASSPIFIYSSSSADATSSSTSSATAARATQSNNSGGGSPFDTTSMAAGLSAGSAYSFVLFLSALLAAYIL